MIIYLLRLPRAKFESMVWAEGISHSSEVILWSEKKKQQTIACGYNEDWGFVRWLSSYILPGSWRNGSIGSLWNKIILIFFGSKFT